MISTLPSTIVRRGDSRRATWHPWTYMYSTGNSYTQFLEFVTLTITNDALYKRCNSERISYLPTILVFPVLYRETTCVCVCARVRVCMHSDACCWEYVVNVLQQQWQKRTETAGWVIVVTLRFIHIAKLKQSSDY